MACFNKDAGKAGVIGYYRELVAAFQATKQHASLIRALDRVVGEAEEAASLKGVWPPLA